MGVRIFQYKSTKSDGSDRNGERDRWRTETEEAHRGHLQVRFSLSAQEKTASSPPGSPPFSARVPGPRTAGGWEGRGAGGKAERGGARPVLCSCLRWARPVLCSCLALVRTRRIVGPRFRSRLCSRRVCSIPCVASEQRQQCASALCLTGFSMLAHCSRGDGCGRKKKKSSTKVAASGKEPADAG